MCSIQVDLHNYAVVWSPQNFTYFLCFFSFQNQILTFFLLFFQNLEIIIYIKLLIWETMMTNLNLVQLCHWKKEIHFSLLQDHYEIWSKLMNWNRYRQFCPVISQI